MKIIKVIPLLAAAALLNLATMVGAAETPPAWTATANFAPPAGAAPAPDAISGRLSFKTTELAINTTGEGEFVRHPWAWWGIFDFLAAQDPDGAVPLFELDAKLFPGLAVDVFTASDGDLVPVQRTIIRRPVKERSKSFWEIIVSPGKTWAATDVDGEWAGGTKAAFPFSLVQSQEGEAWLGLASFYYKDGKVSDLFVQLSNDSAGGFIFWDAKWDVSAWGQVGLSYEPGTVQDQAALETAYAQERAGRLPVKPLSELGDAMAQVGPDAPRGNLLTLAMLKDGVLYRAPVDTPFGPHPNPDEMRVGVWSVSKSLIPGMASMRLAQKYGHEFLDTKLVDYFKEGTEFDYADEASKARWQQVTIRDALNMATGMGPADSDANWAMDSTNTYQWSYSYDLADQIRFYFNQTFNPNVSGPGEKFTYIDQDMWIAVLAMQRFLQGKEGSDTTILEMLIEEVYRPIGVAHFATGTGYTADNAPGLPYSAWGALPTLDDLAKAGRLIANGGRAEDGTQILDAGLVAGLSDSADYELAFKKETATIGGKEYIVPKMSGAGGNYVLSMPNGSVAVVLSHNSYNVKWSDQDLRSLVHAANELKAF